VLCAARGSTGGLTYSVFDGVAWSAFASVASAGLILSRPACATDNDDGVVCAVIRPGNTVYAIRYAAGAWGAFSSIGGIAGSDDLRCIALGVSSPWRVFCLVTGTDGFVYNNAFSGTSWSGWGRFGTLQTNYGVTCGVTSGGGVVCGAIASTDNALYAMTWPARAGWVKQGGTGTGTPSCTSLGTGTVACAFPGVDNKLYHSVGP
jgi:hypothetical protein